MVSPKTKQIIKTCVVLFVMMNVGINVGLFSPTLPDIEIITNSTTSQVSMTLIWAGLASVAGTLAIGPLYDRINGFLLLTICMTLQGIAIGIAPLWRSLAVFQALSAVAFIFNFAIMSGCLSINSALWKVNPTYVVVVIQVTDLMHAVGTAITPQIVRPFIGLSVNTTPGESDDGSPIQSNEGGLLPVQVAYLVIGAFDLATAVVSLVTYCWMRNCCQRRRQPVTSASEFFRQCTVDDDETSLLTDSATGGLHGSASTTVAKLNPRTRSAAGLLAVMSLFFLINGGRDALLTGLLFTYVNQYCSWTVAAGTALVTVYHLTRVIVHAILVPVSRWVPPTTLTVVNLVVLTVGAVLTAASLTGGTSQRGLFATGVVVTGIATSNVHPTAITVVEENIKVKAPIMALLISSIGAGQIVFAPLAGWLMQNSRSRSYPLILVVLAVVGSGLFGLWILLLRRVPRQNAMVRGTSGSVITSSSTADGERTRRRSSSKSTSKYDFDEEDEDIYDRQFRPSSFNAINSIDNES